MFSLKNMSKRRHRLMMAIIIMNEKRNRFVRKESLKAGTKNLKKQKVVILTLAVV